MFLFLFLFLNERSTRCFQTIVIMKRFMNDFILYSFSIIITTSTLFFILIFFHFDFFIILIEMSIIFLKNLFSILIHFVLKILNNFSFSISTRSSRHFIIFIFFSNWIKKFWNCCIFALTTFARWYVTWLIIIIMSRTRCYCSIFLRTRTIWRMFFINTFIKILSL